MIEFNNIKELSSYVSNNSNELYIAAAGYWGSILGEFFNKKDFKWNGFFDRNTNKEDLCGKKICSYNDYGINTATNALVIISVPVPRKYGVAIAQNSVFNQVLSTLRKSNIDENCIGIINNYSVLREIMDYIYGTNSLIKRIRSFKDKHKNQRCFVIGTGPSLTIHDLEMLSHDVSFASNSIYALYPKTFWRPNYYCTIDGLMAKMLHENREKLNYIINNCDAMFTGVERYKYYIDVVKSCENIYFFNTIYEDNIKSHMGFSDDAEMYLYGGGSVTYRLIQLAVYMGFTEIYLLGVDFSFSNEISADGSVKKNTVINHNSITEVEEQVCGYSDVERFGYQYAAFVDLQLWGYEAARLYADTHGIKIFNATRGGKLEVFPRVDIESLF